MPKIKAKYKKSDSYVPMYTNGVIGGISGKGEIVLNFFTELTVLPETQTYNLNNNRLILADNTQKDKTESSLVNIDRVIHSGIILNKTIATELYEWLGNQLQELDRQTSLIENSIQNK